MLMREGDEVNILNLLETFPLDVREFTVESIAIIES